MDILSLIGILGKEISQFRAENKSEESVNISGIFRRNSFKWLGFMIY